ncbi:hypothetical protein ACFORG_10985 [Lutimaribacter marinistellae]|uniref:Uncharacterized protein n=1 Tax=Lutimaribacter marinistellae TaxID=1820329 RepID=A0ABV7TG38_9RHOB
MTSERNKAYSDAQAALAMLKASVRTILETGPSEGMRNVEIGKTLGIYGGHVEHVGHISRTILAVMESEGVVTQNPDSKKWKLVEHWTV